MKTKLKKRNLKKDDSKMQRLVDIEIDEISLVDKPAIGEEFIITKSVEGGKAVKKKKGKAKKTTGKNIQIHWDR